MDQANPQIHTNQELCDALKQSGKNVIRHMEANPILSDYHLPHDRNEQTTNTHTQK